MPKINKKKRWWVNKSNTGNQKGRKERSRQYDSPMWRNIRKQVLIRDKYLCQECLRQGINTAVCQKPWDHAVDHIKPVREGGNFFDANNLETLCKEHHERKSGKTSRGL